MGTRTVSVGGSIVLPPRFCGQSLISVKLPERPEIPVVAAMLETAGAFPGLARRPAAVVPPHADKYGGGSGGGWIGDYRAGDEICATFRLDGFAGALTGTPGCARRALSCSGG